MEKAEQLKELRDLDDKLREIAVEAGDFTRDLATRIQSARDHVADITDELRKGDQPKS